MTDFGTILLVAILREIINYVEESPAINPLHPGIVEFQRVLQKKVSTLQNASGNSIATAL